MNNREDSGSVINNNDQIEEKDEERSQHALLMNTWTLENDGNVNNSR